MSLWPFISLNVVFFTTLALVLRNERYIQKRRLGFFIATLSIGLAQCIVVDKRPFMGLEYEDAYVFSAHARRMSEGFSTQVDPLQTHVCILGSLQDCEIDATSGGHLINFSSITAFSNKFLGYSPFQSNYNNIIFSVLTAFILYITMRRFGASNSTSTILAIAYQISPAMGVFHASALSETISSFYLSVFLYVYASFFSLEDKVDNFRKSDFENLLLASISLTLLLLTKRDNSVLMVLAITVLLRCREAKIIKQKSLSFAGMMIIIFMIYFMIFNFLSVEENETGDIHTKTFSILYMRELLPQFFYALGNPLWFAFVPSLSICGAILCGFDRKSRSYKLPISLLLLCYLIMYSSHYRGYYFIQNGTVDPFDTIRYVTNFYPIIIICASFSLDYFIRKISTPSISAPRSHPITISIAAIACVLATANLWVDWSDQETSKIIEPTQIMVSKIHDEDAYLMTNIPIAFQVLGPPSLKIVDQNMIGNGISIKRMDQIRTSKSKIYWAFNSDNFERDYHRYQEGSEYLAAIQMDQCQQIGTYQFCELSRAIKE